MSISIDELTIDLNGKWGESIIWHTDRERFEIEASKDSGDCNAKLLITLAADGIYDVVAAELRGTGMAVALDQAIAVLNRIRDGVRGVALDVGRCTLSSDYGRCKARHGAPCDFPTEEEMRADLDHHSRKAT